MIKKKIINLWNKSPKTLIKNKFHSIFSNICEIIYHLYAIKSLSKLFILFPSIFSSVVLSVQVNLCLFHFNISFSKSLLHAPIIISDLSSWNFNRPLLLSCVSTQWIPPDSLLVLAYHSYEHLDFVECSSMQWRTIVSNFIVFSIHLSSTLLGALKMLTLSPSEVHLTRRWVILDMTLKYIW